MSADCEIYENKPLHPIPPVTSDPKTKQRFIGGIANAWLNYQGGFPDNQLFNDDTIPAAAPGQNKDFMSKGYLKGNRDLTEEEIEFLYPMAVGRALMLNVIAYIKCRKDEASPRDPYYSNLYNALLENIPQAWLDILDPTRPEYSPNFCSGMKMLGEMFGLPNYLVGQTGFAMGGGGVPLTPLVLDLDGDGVETISLFQGIHFGLFKRICGPLAA